MVRIRLRRMGLKGQPSYRIVVTDQRSPRDGRFLEQIGTYDPMQKPHTIRFTGDRLDYWLSVGAQPSDTVRSLIKKHRREATGAEAAS